MALSIEFGRYRGTPVDELPEDYIRWLADPARELVVPGKNYRPLPRDIVTYARQRVIELDKNQARGDFAKRCLGGHPTEFDAPVYIIECEGDCHSASGAYAIDYQWFYSLEEALACLSAEFPVESRQVIGSETITSRSTPDPEDDKIVIWEVLPSGHRRAVWGFFGWHFTDSQETYACGQGSLPGDTEPLYWIACHDM